MAAHGGSHICIKSRSEKPMSSRHIFHWLRLMAVALGVTLSTLNTIPATALEDEASAPAVQIVHMKVKTDALKDFEAFMRGINTIMQDVPGFISISVYQNKAAPTEFTLVERWRTEADHKAHIARISASGELAKFGEMLAAAPSGGYFDAF
jgi:quinol monooxygenase YgiN